MTTTATLAPDARRALRPLVGAYLARPDALAWAAAADLYEEHGDGAKALLWRRRARWFGPLTAAWQEAAVPLPDGPPNEKSRLTTAWLGRRHLAFTRKRRCVLLDFMVRCGPDLLRMRQQWLPYSRDARYAVRRILHLIDAYAYDWEETAP